MSNSLKERIISALLTGVIFFMLLCVDYKLFSYREDWLSFSLMWAISWSIGKFVSKTIAEATKDIIEVILLEAMISFVVVFVMTFITGVIFSLPNWDYVVSRTCVSFAEALLINNKWKRD